MLYRKITETDLTADTFVCFHHDQNWNRQWKKREGTWVLENVCCRRLWSEEKRIWLSDYLKQQIHDGGSVIAAFDGTQIIAFACIGGQLKGCPVRYSNLTMLFVDDRFQRSGIGKRLFISAIPSESTVGFYFAVGCRDAEYLIPEFVDTEEDRFLELCL